MHKEKRMGMTEPIRFVEMPDAKRMATAYHFGAAGEATRFAF